MDVSDAMRLSQLADENTQLRKMVSEQALDISVRKDVLSKTSEARVMQRGCPLCPDGMPGLPAALCATLDVNCGTVRRPPPHDLDAVLSRRLRGLAENR